MDCSLPGLCPWTSPGKNTRVGCHLLLQGIFPTQELNLCLPALKADSLANREAPVAQALPCKDQRVRWVMGERWEACTPLPSLLPNPHLFPALPCRRMAKVPSSLKPLTYKTVVRTAGSSSSLANRWGHCQLTLTGLVRVRVSAPPRLWAALQGQLSYCCLRLNM